MWEFYSILSLRLKGLNKVTLKNSVVLGSPVLANAGNTWTHFPNSLSAVDSPAWPGNDGISKFKTKAKYRR